MWTSKGMTMTDDQKDAERYRWLRNYALQTIVAGPIVCMADKWGWLHEHEGGSPVRLQMVELDRAIDAAMAVAAEREGRK